MKPTAANPPLPVNTDTDCLTARVRACTSVYSPLYRRGPNHYCTSFVPVSRSPSLPRHKRVPEQQVPQKPQQARQAVPLAQHRQVVPLAQPKQAVPLAQPSSKADSTSVRLRSNVVASKPIPIQQKPRQVIQPNSKWSFDFLLFTI